jgi:hypothetical protein
MEIRKGLKAGYQGKKDSMREKAERLLNHPGHAKDVYPSKSAVEKEKMRPYKKGGHVKDSDSKCSKFAMGGAAKIRHGQATKDGMPTKPKKKSTKDFL